MTMHVQLDRTYGIQRRAGPLPAFLDDLLSIEMCFMLYLTAGRYKALPEFEFLPVDPTMFFFVLTVALIIHKVGAREMRLLPLDAPDLLMMGFVALGVVSVFWSSLDPKNIDKAWRFVLASTSAYFIARILVQDPERRDRLVRLLIGFSVALMAYYSFHRWVVGISMWELENTGRIRGNNYLEYGAHAGWMFFGTLAMVVFGPRKLLIPALIGAVAGLFLLTLIGARGSLVFSALAIPLAGAMLVIGRRREGGGVQRLVLLLVVLAVMAWVGYAALVAIKGFSEASEQLYTLERLSGQISNEATYSMDIRAEGRDLAFRRWLELPLFGWGLGEFRLQLPTLDYPHNLMLETLMELGLAGAVPFAALQIIALFACLRAIRNPDSSWIEMMIALKFLTEIVSHASIEGYLGDNRMYFTLIALALSIGRTKPQAPKSQTPKPQPPEPRTPKPVYVR